VVLGGQGSITGSVIAAVILTVLPELLRNGFTWLAAKAPQITQVAPNLSADVLRMLLYAFLLVLLMLTRPQGLFGASEVSLRGLFAGRRGRTPGKAV
jgi:branched-chain amino acid transport system permease protein